MSVIDRDPLGAAGDLATHAAVMAEDLFGDVDGEPAMRLVTSMALASIAISLHAIATGGAAPVEPAGATS